MTETSSFSGSLCLLVFHLLLRCCHSQQDDDDEEEEEEEYIGSRRRGEETEEEEKKKTQRQQHNRQRKEKNQNNEMLSKGKSLLAMRDAEMSVIFRTVFFRYVSIPIFVCLYSILIVFPPKKKGRKRRNGISGRGLKIIK